MSTWMFMNLIIDVSFALLLAGLVFGFMFMRERKIRDDVTRSLLSIAEGSKVTEAPQSKVAPVNRVEKYLEAVRLYRKGVNRSEIEQTLGISMMELELIGNIK